MQIKGNLKSQHTPYSIYQGSLEIFLVFKRLYCLISQMTRHRYGIILLSWLKGEIDRFPHFDISNFNWISWSFLWIGFFYWSSNIWCPYVSNIAHVSPGKLSLIPTLKLIVWYLNGVISFCIKRATSTLHASSILLRSFDSWNSRGSKKYSFCHHLI